MFREFLASFFAKNGGSSQQVGTDSNKKKRTKNLNIVYFVDSKSTKTLTISTRWASFLVFMLLTLIGWSGISSFLLVEQIQITNQKRDRISSLLHTILQYQIQYDQVYERTYPGEISQIKKQAVATDVKEEKPVQKSIPAPIDSKYLSTDQNPIAYEAKQLIDHGASLALNFAIKNQSSPQKTDGKLWGYATFIDDQGSIEHIKAPSGVEINLDQMRIHKGSDYSIKYYKAKSLRFKKPDRPGQFKSIQVFNSDGKKIYSLKKLTLPQKNLAKSSSRSEAEPRQ